MDTRGAYHHTIGRKGKFETIEGKETMNINDHTTQIRVLQTLQQNGLTKAQASVAQYLFLGISNGEIAKKLFVSDKTVKFHLGYIYKKLKVSNRMECLLKMQTFFESRGLND